MKPLIETSNTQMNPSFEFNLLQTRRQFFGNQGLRMGGLALGMLAAQTASGANGPKVHPALHGLPHFAPKAKSIIYLHMNGGPSQIDMWDYKPKLKEQFDKDLPDSIRLGQRITTMTSGQARLRLRPANLSFLSMVSQDVGLVRFCPSRPRS